VDTDWDLGVGDATAIWFSQSLYTGEVQLIDYYESSGVGLPHYLDVLNNKRTTHGYVYAYAVMIRHVQTTGTFPEIYKGGGKKKGGRKK
jgi:phage terminase large subunit